MSAQRGDLVTRSRDRLLAAIDGDGNHRMHLADLFAYLLLAVSALIAYFSQDLYDGAWQTRPVMLATAGVTLGWIWWWTTAHRAWRSDARRMRVYYAGRTVLALALSVINPFYAIFGWIGFLDLDVFRARGRRIAVVATAFILAGAQSGGLPPQSVAQGVLVVLLLGINAGLAAAMLRIHERMQSLSVQRAATIAQLEESNARLADALAENAALQRQLLVQAREAGVLDERQRLAREIHDTIAQGLAGVITQLQAAEQSLDPVRARDHRERAADLARASLEEARRSVRDLAPRELEQDALPTALSRLVAGWSEASGVHAELELVGAWRPLHDEVESTLLRVAQESLTNVARHAGATRTVVTLSTMDEVVALDVRDDGRGFAPEEPVTGTAGGFGIVGMRHRAQRLAGELAVESAPGEGAAVSVRLPALAPVEGSGPQGGARPPIPPAGERVQS